MVPVNDRIKYYLGDTQKVKEPENGKYGYDVPMCLNYREYQKSMTHFHPNTAYPRDVSRLLKYSDPKDRWIQCGDSPYTGPQWPVGVKVRDTHNPASKGVILNLNSNRLWGHIFKYSDPAWEVKKTDFMWRGADTGRGVRLAFVNKFREYDVGFSAHVQDSRRQPELYPAHLIKPKVPIPYLLKYKYLPIVDGNDKSSSLGWVMASNSVPIMPVPRYHSWMCESFLEPGVHYVEVKRDFSDMIEKIEWCKQNDAECKKIAENGKQFMLQFMNTTQEQYIEIQVVTSM